ncbi:hypothetical protein L2E82_37103 [Cichorium intybus]|uniref:Uncharacterized protein n=1 Tax=Cichorium intybus TaxID=13427 RepID=A0ACB9AEN4_CICIN|nr:hypothetical protein L2E82_37103 [Cichorium intybus]
MIPRDLSSKERPGRRLDGVAGSFQHFSLSENPTTRSHVTGLGTVLFNTYKLLEKYDSDYSLKIGVFAKPWHVSRSALPTLPEHLVTSYRSLLTPPDLFSSPEHSSIS